MASRRTSKKVRAGYLAVFLLTGLFYYEFLGAAPTPSEKPEELAWWRPAGWVTESDSTLLAPLQEMAEATYEAQRKGETDRSGLVPVVLFAALPIALTVLGFLLFESTWVRTLLLALGLTLCAFSYYGWLMPGIWQLFTWRWPASLLLTAGYTALFAMAPALANDARRRSPWFLGLVLLLLFVPIYLMSTEVTGTNPTLYLNTSPWPVVTLIGFLLVGLVLGVVHFAVGLGLFVRQALPGVRGLLVGGALAALIAVLLAEIPFEARRFGTGLLLALAAGGIALLAGRRAGPGDVPLAMTFLGAGLALLASIQLGRWQAEAFQAEARNEIAPQVIAALDRYHEDRACFPDELVELVPDYLPEIPMPRVGWFRDASEAFNYIDLGSSYLLEFPGVLWVQCAYSPPYLDFSDDADACDPSETEASGVGAWSCEIKPPELW
ncbi:MAG: hypothetical protein JRG92_19365 [Deltaproteobacteria bacterium]|nr:hypothetical protein [Deltaproteobacteria bacterium]